MTSSLRVAVGGHTVGTLFYEDYQYAFRYDAPLELDPTRHLTSLTMPVRARSYETQVLPPPFQSVLPEGALLEQLRSRFGKVLHLEDDFQLLKLVGHNTVGRLTFWNEDAEEPAAPQAPFGLDEVLRHPDARTLFVELVEAYGFRFGVGGIQPKALLGVGGHQATIPTENLLLKLAGADFPQLPVNEHFCLEASRAAQIPTVESHLSDTHDILAVRRFDRDERGLTLAFEEICALLRRSRHGKYDGSYEDIARVITQIPCEDPVRSLERFFSMVVLSMTVRNGDAHLKNFGVLYDTTDSVQLAPTYDVVTTTAYVSGDQPALSLGGSKVWPRRDALKRFGVETCDLRRAGVEDILDRVAAGVRLTLETMHEFATRHGNSADLCGRMGSAWEEGLAYLEG